MTMHQLLFWTSFVRVGCTDTIKCNMAFWAILKFTNVMDMLQKLWPIYRVHVSVPLHLDILQCYRIRIAVLYIKNSCTPLVFLLYFMACMDKHRLHPSSEKHSGFRETYDPCDGGGRDIDFSRKKESWLRRFSHLYTIKAGVSFWAR